MKRTYIYHWVQWQPQSIRYNKTQILNTRLKAQCFSAGPFLQNIIDFNRGFMVWHASKWLILRPTQSIPFETCICSTCWDHSFPNWHIFRTLNFMTNIPHVFNSGMLERLVYLSNLTTIQYMFEIQLFWCNILHHLEIFVRLANCIIYFGCFHRTLQRVWLANRGRLLFRTPGPVPFGTCICSNVETILSWTCHVYGPFEFRTSLGTSILVLLINLPYSPNAKFISGDISIQ